MTVPSFQEDSQSVSQLVPPLPSRSAARPVNILVSESTGFSPQAAAALSQVGSLFLKDLDRAALLSSLDQTEVLWVRLRHQIDAAVMDAAPRLKIVATPTTGLNHIDLQAAERRNIRVLSLRGEVSFLKDIRATAEHTIALMLAALRHLPSAVQHVRKGGWDRERFLGRELYGKVAGIVGYGRLGRIVARYLQAFDMQVLAADPNVDRSTIEDGVTLVGVEELLGQADFVSLHVNHCQQTDKFFGRRQFALMKDGAWLFNTARGELVDEQALCEALESGRLGGAALDVLCDERSAGMGDHPLVEYAQRHDNLLITPHIGGNTFESREKTELFLADRLSSLLQQGYEIDCRSP
jgi:D-3-phosphoglycerate dehydrogenase